MHHRSINRSVGRSVGRSVDRSVGRFPRKLKTSATIGGTRVVDARRARGMRPSAVASSIEARAVVARASRARRARRRRCRTDDDAGRDDADDGDASRRRRATVVTRSMDDAHASTSTSSGMTGADVFVAAVPLDGFEGAATSALGKTTGVFDRHWMVLVRHAGDAHAAVYDFLPKNPRSPVTAARLLAGGRVPGETRARRLAGVPSARCCFVGKTRSGLGGRIAIESAVVDFHSRWDEDLVLGSHDCRDHASDLAKWLTCEYGEGVEMTTTANGELTCEKTCTLGVDDDDDDDDGDDDSGRDDDDETVARTTTTASKKKSTAKKKGKKKSAAG